MTTSRTLLAGLSCVALVGLSGCGGEDPATDEKASEPTASSEASCELKGKSGGSATLEQNSDGLVMTFSGLPVPSSGDVLYSMTAYDEAGENGGQLGVKYQNGQQIAFFVFDFGDAQQTNLDGEPEVSGDTLTATFPESNLGPLSGVEVASWSAAYSVNGNDVGQCPGGSDSLSFPE